AARRRGDSVVPTHPRRDRGGRRRGVLCRYAIWRICFREQAHRGLIPGGAKPGWQGAQPMADTTDPSADLLTRIRNANNAYHDSLEISGSKLKAEVVRILQEEGFIKGFEVVKDPKQDKIKVSLKYGPRRERVI